jgi:galactokinase
VNQIRQWHAPARVNLIGEHTDYSGGLALPIAIDRGITIKARRRNDDTTRVWSLGQQAQFHHAGVHHSGAETVTGWAAYLAGVAWALNEKGIQPPALDLVLESDIPVGAGLSSSAALTCATALAMTTFAGVTLDREEIALIAAKAENDYVGAPTGLLDQFSVCFAEADHALLLDFSTDIPSAISIPAQWTQTGLTLAVIDTTSRHSHATGGYRTRREEVERAAAELGIEALGRVSLDQVVSLSDPVLKARTQHVFTENARVRGAAKAMRENNWDVFGSMLTASHNSLRDDFHVSCPELDAAVEIALAQGALGARMTGGGFGGCAIALIETGRVDELRSALESAYEARGWSRPEVFCVSPSAGARELPWHGQGNDVG